MNVIGRLWRYLLAEPFAWIFYCFFQPLKFMPVYEQSAFPGRLRLLLRLFLPVFIICYPFCLITHTIIYAVYNTRSTDYSNVGSLLLSIAIATVISIGAGMIGGLIGGVRIGIMLGLALGVIGVLLVDPSLGMIKGMAVAIALGLTAGVIGGPAWRIFGGVIGGVASGLTWSFTNGPTHMLEGVDIAIAFFLAYVLGYYRLPLYLISASSTISVRIMSDRYPTRIFTYLQRSALYWDECVYLPLPGLQHTLLRAVEQDIDLAQKEIAFILAQRPQQKTAVRAALLEVIIHSQETRTTLQDVALSWSDLNDILPQDDRLMGQQWMTALARLSDASRDAARYCSSLEIKSKRSALEDMISNLKKIHPNMISGNGKQSARLKEIVHLWLEMAQREKNVLDQAPQDIGQIDNPYTPGAILKPQDSLFVGRRDVVQILRDALERKSNRPPFFLSGERRMGKSSTLRQLPHLLGSRYLPITCDLQTPDILASDAIFLATIANTISSEANTRRIAVKKLDEKRLHEASRKNASTVYHVFNQWLMTLEHVLEQHDSTVLLAFDEFEKLDEPRQKRDLDLRLLLDWFRNVIQHRSRLILLFSGVRTLDEMGRESGINWLTYFVNVQILKVRFLSRSEAQQLITNPKPMFPGTEIFKPHVVDEIIRVTGCHPFLIQAICSALIERLNANCRNQAEIADVRAVINVILDKWHNYFQDLWRRTDKDQRLCLFAIHTAGLVTRQTITEQISLKDEDLKQVLENLEKRDLIISTENGYRIATPVFEQWLGKYR